MQTYCYYCDKITSFFIVKKEIETTIYTFNFKYLAKIPYCCECQNEIYIGELSDQNIRTANDIYRKLVKLRES